LNPFSSLSLVKPPALNPDNSSAAPTKFPTGSTTRQGTAPYPLAAPGVLGTSTGIFPQVGVARKLTGGKKSNIKQCISNKSKRKLMLGADIGLEDSVSLALCTLVGCLSYRSMCKTSIALICRVGTDFLAASTGLRARDFLHDERVVWISF